MRYTTPKKKKKHQGIVIPTLEVALATFPFADRKKKEEEGLPTFALKGNRKLHLSKMTLSSAVDAQFSISAQIGVLDDKFERSPCLVIASVRLRSLRL